MSDIPSGVAEGFVLVGRASRFPGKFFATVHHERLIDRAVGSLQRVGLRVRLVSLLEGIPAPPAPVLHDRYGQGPLGGVRTILEERSGPFVLAGADMPWIDPAAIASLVRRYRPGRSVVPIHPDSTLEVLHAVYDLPRDRVEEHWTAGRALKDLVRALADEGKVDLVPASELPPETFADVNTPADLAPDGAPPG